MGTMKVSCKGLSSQPGASGSQGGSPSVFHTSVQPPHCCPTPRSDAVLPPPPSCARVYNSQGLRNDGGMVAAAPQTPEQSGRRAPEQPHLRPVLRAGAGSLALSSHPAPWGKPSEETLWVQLRFAPASEMPPWVPRGQAQAPLTHTACPSQAPSWLPAGTSAHTFISSSISDIFRSRARLSCSIEQDAEHPMGLRRQSKGCPSGPV